MLALMTTIAFSEKLNVKSDWNAKSDSFYRMCKQTLKVGDFFFKMRLNRKVWICQTSLTSYVFRMKTRVFFAKKFTKNVGLYYRHKVSRQLLCMRPVWWTKAYPKLQL